MSGDLFFQKKYPKTVILRLVGMFFKGMNQSAYILSLVTGYQMKSTSKGTDWVCGFPGNALDKVLSKLEANKVNFAVFMNDKTVAEHDYGEDNRYDELVSDYKPCLKPQKQINEKFSGINQEESGESVKSDVATSAVQFSEQKDFIAVNQTEAYLELQKHIDAQLIKGKRVVSMSFYGERISEHRFTLSGVIVYDCD